jgi:hypothetical protein
MTSLFSTNLFRIFVMWGVCGRYDTLGELATPNFFHVFFDVFQYYWKMTVKKFVRGHWATCSQTKGYLSQTLYFHFILLIGAKKFLPTISTVSD